MKKLLTVTILALAMPLAAWANDVAPPPCIQASLEYYITNFQSGCQIDDKLFLGFDYTPGGTVIVGAEHITVTPDSTPLNPGLQFTGTWNAAEGETSDLLIEFTVSVLPGGGAIKDASLSVLGSADGGGLVDVLEGLCLGGLFSEAGQCVGGDVNTDLHVFVGLGGNLTYDETTFAPVMIVDVKKDIGLTAIRDTQGFDIASISEVRNNFSEVPEPATLTLFGTGLVAIGGMIRRRKNLKK